MKNANVPGELGPLSTTDDECLVLDLDGRVVDANDAACRVLQRSRAEVVGGWFWELCTCLTQSAFEHRVEALRAEGPQGLLGHLRRPDGTLVATETRMWLAQHGGVERVFALARELRGVHGLAEERDRLAHLVAASSEVVVQLDRDLRVTYANPAALERLGIERMEDAQGLVLPELVVLAQRDSVESRVVPRLISHGRWEGELELRSWSDAERVTPCSVHAFAVHDTRTRERVGYALAGRDVATTRAVEARRSRLLALVELSRRVAHLLLSSDDLNAAIAEILSGAGRVLGASRAMLGRYREDGRWVLRTHEWTPSGGSVHRTDARAEPEADYRWATEVLASGRALRVDDAATVQGRSLLQLGERALLALPVTIGGELANLFAFACERPVRWEDDEVAAVQLMVDSFARGVERQIAERERARAQRELEHSVEREKRASRYKSEFLASMSHELRTPMTAIRGYAELLGKKGADPESQETWIRNLRRSTEYLLNLVHDVLDLSKIEAGRMELACERADLAALIGGMEDLFAGYAREKGVELSVEVEGEIPRTMECDPVRVKQILVNLTGNALKFTSLGSVRVRASVGGGVAARRLEVRVTDTGPGIPEDALGRLFQPFSQVHRSTGGTGLGLQIARSLARLHGGDVTVESELGKGSTFTLGLPIAGAEGTLRALPSRSAAASKDERTFAAPPELAGKRVLVVDDSPETREVLAHLLKEAGVQCEVERNGQSGVARALTAMRVDAPFDAILMDMSMPVLDGFDATKKLLGAGVPSPVIALTALTMAGDEERCRLAGCADYVAKPVMPALLLDTLARCLRLSPVSGGDPEGGQVISITRHPRFGGLAERYLASFPELVERLRDHARAGELDEVRELVHRLRGTAASYGIAAVAEAAARCEDAIGAGAPRSEVARTLDELVGRLLVARSA